MKPASGAIAIIGAGFSGIGMAIALQRAGLRFTIYEAANEIGGTWRDNRYPGVCCDVPSIVYSLSYAQSSEWTRLFGPGKELLAYMHELVERFDLAPHIQLGRRFEGAAYQPDGSWKLTFEDGEEEATSLILGLGPLQKPRMANLPGVGTFQGPEFHSARWPEIDLSGKRVGVIGTGASAIQIVPAIVDQVKSLRLYQRTPPWVFPRGDRPIPEGLRKVFRRSSRVRNAARILLYWRMEVMAAGFVAAPGINRWRGRTAANHLAEQIPDPELRKRLTPNYVMGCKRILLSDDYYPALMREHVELRPAATEISADGVTSSEGFDELDVLVHSTGFQVTDPAAAVNIVGRNGTLAEAWKHGAEAYRGTHVAGFPNLYTLMGPNTGLGHNSVLLMLEAQATYVAGLLRHAHEQGFATIEPKPSAQRSYNAELQAKLAHTVWQTGGCSSWYQDHDQGGKNTTLWPGFTFQFIRQMARVRFEDLHIR